MTCIWKAMNEGYDRKSDNITKQVNPYPIVEGGRRRGNEGGDLLPLNHTILPLHAYHRETVCTCVYVSELKVCCSKFKYGLVIKEYASGA